MINEQKIPVVIRGFYWFYFLVVISWLVPAGAYMWWCVITGICVILYHTCFSSKMSVNDRHGGCMICVCKSFATAGVVPAACCCVPILPQTLPPSCCDWTDFGCGQGAAAALTTHSLFELTVWCTTDGTGPGMATSRHLCWANVDLTFP